MTNKFGVISDLVQTPFRFSYVMSLPIHPHGQQSLSAGLARSPPTTSREVDHAESGSTPSPRVTASTTRQNLFLALHDFLGQSQDELSFRNGDVLEVIEKTNNGNLRSP